MTDHTSTPWRVDEPGLWIVADNVPKGPMHVADVRGWGYLTGAGYGALGLKSGDALAIQRANAAFIVRAVNAHNALVDALKEAQPFIDNAPTDTARLSLDIREALSLAGEIQLDPPGCVSA